MNKQIAVVAFGRENPPTIGHRKLARTMADVASKHGTKAMLFLSHTQDKIKNPLPYDRKIYWAKKQQGDLVDVIDSDAKTALQVLEILYKKGYTDLVYVGGGDRIGGEEDISSIINKYNGVPDKKGNIIYNFNTIEFVNAGERDDASDDLESKASASLVRKLAAQNDFESFKELVYLDESDALELFEELRSYMILDEALITEALSNANSKLMSDLGHIFETALYSECDPNMISIAASRNRHPRELMRIGANTAGGSAYTEDDLRSFVENAFYNLQGEPLKVGGVEVVLDDIGDYGRHGGGDSSGSFNSYKVTYHSDDDFANFFIAVKAGKLSSKKALTPNKVLTKAAFGGRIPYLALPDYVQSVGKNPLNDFIAGLLAEVMTTGDDSSYQQLAKGIDYLKCKEGSANPGPIDFTATFRESAAAFNDVCASIGMSDEAKQSIIQTIDVDLSEVIGAAALAYQLSKTGADMMIEFPKGSTEPIVDYMLYESSTSTDQIKVSAKKDGGGKASSTGMVRKVIEKADDDIKEFCDWFNDEHLSVSGTKGHANVADKMCQLLESGAHANWEEQLMSAFNSANGGDIALLYKEIRAGSNDNIYALMDEVNHAIRSLQGRKHLIKDAFPKDKTINKSVFIKNKAVYMLCQLFVNLLNASGLTKAVYNRFIEVFGCFMQVYLLKPSFESGEYHFRAVFTSHEGDVIDTGTSPEFEFYEDCANTPPDGEMTIKKIALSLVH